MGCISMYTVPTCTVRWPIGVFCCRTADEITRPTSSGRSKVEASDGRTAADIARPTIERLH